MVADLDTKNFSNRQTVHVNEVCECVFALEQKKILLLEVIWIWIMFSPVLIASVGFKEIIMLLKINYWCLLIHRNRCQSFRFKGSGVFCLYVILRGQDGHQHPRDLPHQWTGRCSKQQTLQMLDRYFNINDLCSDVSFYLRSSKRIRPEKFKPEQDLNPSLCDASAVPHRLNYQANWELVTMWVYDKPADSGYMGFD